MGFFYEQSGILEQEVKRDYIVNNYYISKGWNMLRIWEHQVKEDFEMCISHIIQFVDKAKERKANKNVNKKEP
jgi:DNA mismatch endonuclease (patch repair protein)